MAISEATMRRMVEERFGDDLSHDEVENLMVYVRQQLDCSRKLQELDLGGLDPRTMHYILDRRLTR